MLVEGDRAGSYRLISPSGVRIALFGYTLGTSRPRIMPLVDGLDCGEGHKTEEQAIKHIVHQYELLTTTRMERIRIQLSQAFAHGAWSAIAAVAATIAAVMGVLNFYKETARSLVTSSHCPHCFLPAKIIRLPTRTQWYSPTLKTMRDRIENLQQEPFLRCPTRKGDCPFSLVFPLR